MIDISKYQIVERGDFNEYWYNNMLECIAFNDGWIMWYNEKYNLHNINGPAVIKPDGSEMWYFNGKLHNENGPAIIKREYVEYWNNGIKIK